MVCLIIFMPCLFSSVAQSCLSLCDPMDCSTSGLPVHHKLPEFTQTHVHWVGDAIQPSHPLSSPSPPAFNLSQHQGLFQWAMPFGEHNLDWWSPIIDFFYNSYFYPILDIFAKSKVFFKIFLLCFLPERFMVLIYI